MIGASPNRIDGIEKVTGDAKFTGDISIPDLLEAKILRSPLPHASIESIDVRKAEALAGVIAVLTREDLKDIDPYYGNCLRDRAVVAIDRVRFVGEPVAVVAAQDGLTAEEALSLIDVQYKELPCVSDIDAALTEGAPRLHESLASSGEFHDVTAVGVEFGGNICHRERFVKGDPEAAFLQAEEIIEETFEFPMVYQYAMEPHTACARFNRAGITLWSSSAHPFLVRAELAHMFHLPQSKVEVIVPYVGGAYGSKSYFKIEPLAVAMARKTGGRPVRVVQSVAEAMLTTRRHSARIRVKTGVKKDGTLIAREAEVLLDTGAYADNGPRVAKRAVSRMIGPYDLSHCKVDVLALYTNTVPAGSMRSIGGPQTIWALESHMDSIAERVGIDPLEYRLQNLLRRGEVLKPGATTIDADLVAGTKAAVAKLDWTAPTKLKGRGAGVAIGVSDSEAMPVSVALVRLLADGSIILSAGTTEVGQGARTILCQIVAQELAVPINSVTMSGTDSAATPFDRSTGASRSTTVMGSAVKAAAEDLRGQLIAAAAETFKTPTNAVTLNKGKVYADDKSLPYGGVVSAYFGMPGGELIGRGYIRPGGSLGATFPLFWETGMGGAEIFCDGETGEVRITKYVTVADVGKAINPMQAEGQDEGAAIQGLGHTLFESLIYEQGQPLNANLIDYRVPRFTDLPDSFDSTLIENQDGPGPYGAKGMGESGIVSIAPAVGNALYRATGARVLDLPMTPERVWRALIQAKQSEEMIGRTEMKGAH
ncbi:MAG TPA: xanthine dehydrogenase family protein molybdopterin-binding subunit [Candidatus Binatia bacterium]|nr:xanthine dehydrogenase family protein molybdopterin-binding subunit [Candidatus Binatia bacterium]